jgi:hypothetical protein
LLVSVPIGNVTLIGPVVALAGTLVLMALPPSATAKAAAVPVILPFDSARHFALRLWSGRFGLRRDGGERGIREL